MSDLLAFSKQIDSALRSGDRAPHWKPDEADRYMAEIEGRRDCFREKAERIMRMLVRPRLLIFAGYFPNASPVREEAHGRMTLMLGYSERFPTCLSLGFGVEHDVRFEKLFVGYEASMMPAFFKFNDRDKLVLKLDEVDERRVTAWVEERLHEVLDAYLQLDRGGGEFEDEAATDPICGMRITRSAAAAIESYCGHPYFFCSAECASRFAADPKAHVRIKGM